MVDLSAQRILEVWEQGCSCTNETRINETRTQALLGLAMPELSSESLSEIILGERNKKLLDIHQQMFGSVLQGYIECSECGEALDLEFEIGDFGFASISHISETHSIKQGNLTVEIRLPNSNDLNALESLNNIEEGRRLLLSRCILECHRDGSDISFQDISEDELGFIEEAVSSLDPRLEVVFDLQCPECAHTWKTPLEIGSFLWSEYDVYARQLLENVHVLASNYGWSEKNILSMSQQRRKYYLERLMQ